MRRLESYVRRYGPEFGPVYYHVLQSQAAHAGVSARLRHKLDVLTGKAEAPRKPSEPLPLFPDDEQPGVDESAENAALAVEA